MISVSSILLIATRVDTKAPHIMAQSAALEPIRLSHPNNEYLWWGMTLKISRAWRRFTVRRNEESRVDPIITSKPAIMNPLPEISDKVPSKIQSRQTRYYLETSQTRGTQYTCNVMYGLFGYANWFLPINTSALHTQETHVSIFN